MPPRLRRVVYVVTAGAVASRLFVLGQERGWAVVLPVALTVTAWALGAWFAHLLLHELAHWAAALTQGFVVRGVRVGPVAVTLAGAGPQLRLGGDLGGGVSLLPRGDRALSRRLRVVALAGPAASVLATVALGLAWRSSGQPLSSPLGIFVVMGAFVGVTALLPGGLLPRRPESGSDLDLVLQPRAVLAYWVNAAALEATSRGAPLATAIDWAASERLLPTSGPPEPFELGWCFCALDAGQVDRALPILERLAARLDDDAPDWLIADTWQQLGCARALGRGDVDGAQACLAKVTAAQSLPWYDGLLRAAVAQARGDLATARNMMLAWSAQADAHPLAHLLRAGNRWVAHRIMG